MMAAVRCRPLFVAAAFLVSAAVASPVTAQPRPLPMESVDGVGAGNISLGIGADYTRDYQYPLSGLAGDLSRLALVRIDVGVGAIADVELTGGARDYLQITSMTPAPLSSLLQLTSPTSTSSFDDIIIGAKVRLYRSDDGGPGVAVRFGTRLPNAKHESGLGQNTTDFYSGLLVDQTIASARVTESVGLGILGDPLRGDRRVNSLLYSLEIRQPIASSVSLVIGADGRSGPDEPGLEPRAVSRFGIAWTHGPTRIDLVGTHGLTKIDGDLGGAINLAFTFHAFTP
jgi:hypothetical protein